MFNPGHGQHAAHLRLHRVVRQAVVSRVEFARGRRTAKLEQHHIEVGAAVVDDTEVLEVGVAGGRELQQVGRLVLGRHAKDAHHLRVGERRRGFDEVVVANCAGCVLEEVDDSLGDLDKRVAGASEGGPVRPGLAPSRT